MDHPVTDDRYDEDYFMRGKESGKSLYENYRWLPDLTIPMVEKITEHLGVELDDTIVDFGCARGYTVRALEELDFEYAYGVDVSEWAIKNCDKAVKGRVGLQWPDVDVDWIFAKDVLEHIPTPTLQITIDTFAARARKGFFIVVPLATPLGKYEVPEYEEDVTHVIRWTMHDWVETILHSLDHTWEISARYRLKGVKDNYAQFSRGNAFITCRKV